MAATIVPVSATPRSTTERPLNAQVGALPVPASQPLWRFALVGLGPLTALAMFGLLFGLFQHLS